MHKSIFWLPNRRETRNPKLGRKVILDQRPKHSGVRLVTVCLAALAAKGDCIVCIADKALSYDDVTWDSDVEKIISLGPEPVKSALALTAGADLYISRYIRKIQNFNGYAGPRDSLIKFLEKAFEDCLHELQDIEILSPAALSREEYKRIISCPTVNDYIIDIGKRLEDYRKDFDMQILVCGFEAKTIPYILYVTQKGIVIDYTINGLFAIGAGAERAMSRMLFSRHTREDGVSHTLFDCFDAKASAEMTESVGVDWDAYLISGPKVKRVVPEAKPLLDRVWKDRNESPFRTKVREADELPRAPKNWRMQLKKMVAASLGSAFDESGDITAF